MQAKLASLLPMSQWLLRYERASWWGRHDRGQIVIDRFGTPTTGMPCSNICWAIEQLTFEDFCLLGCDPSLADRYKANQFHPVVDIKELKICVVFEGRDGAGRGGTIKAISERVSPRVFRVEKPPFAHFHKFQQLRAIQR